MTTPTITLAQLPVLGTVADTTLFLSESAANVTYQTSGITLKQYMASMPSMTVTGTLGVSGIATVGGLVATYVNAGTIGNVGATLTGTLSTAAQTNITSVGALTGLIVNGATAINSGLLSAGGGISTTQISAITLGNTGATLTGTLSSGAQNNITSATGVTAVGTLTSLTVSGTVQPTSNAAVNLGGTSNYWNNFYSVTATHNSLAVGGQGITNAGALSTTGALTVQGASVLAGGITTNTIQASTIGNSGATLTGTISTAAQPNITTVGTLGNLVVSNQLTSQTLYTNGFYWQANGIPVNFGAGGGGGGTPVGNNQTVQFNNNGSFGGASNLYYFTANSTTVITATTAATGTGTGALQVAGGASIAGSLYAGALYDSGNRVINSTGGPGNLSIVAGNITLPVIGSGTNAGSATSIPTIVTDQYGRIISLTANSVSTTFALAGTNGSGSVNGGGTISFATSNGLTSTVIGSTITLATGQDIQTTANPIFAGVFAPIKTNAQPYITSLGTLSSLTVAGDTHLTGNLFVNGSTTTLNSTSVTTNDLQYVAAANAGSTAAANGAGLVTPYSAFTYSSSTTGWASNVGITLSSGAFTGSGSGLTSIPAGQLTGAIPTGVLGNSSLFIGTTAIPLNRSGSSMLLNGVSIDSNAATATKLQTPTTINGVSFDGSAGSYTIPAAAGTLTGTALPSTVTSIPGVISGLTVSGSILPNANVAYNIGSSTAWFNTFYGTSSHAVYADLAEKYASDADYAPGTIVIFGGDSEITISDTDHDFRIAGVISTDPAYLMNSQADGLPVALKGRVPCFVQGPISKGDRVVNFRNGLGRKLDKSLYDPGCVVGHSLEDIADDSVQVIEVVIGKY